MPYASVDDLPEKIREILPLHAQEIYEKSFNNAYGQYQSVQKRRDPNEDVEVIAHKVAWAAVKKEYEKGPDGKWIRKEK
jgi:cation transport regulator